MKIVLEKRVGLLLKTIIAIILAGSVTNTWASNELVGSDGGSISVGNSGQAVWSMPLEVPSGINGVAPNLSLSVSTSGGNGSLGVGGGLSGLSSISRCGRTIYQDGYFQAPQYQTSDSYCLDGARLVLESGVYGASGSVYRTNIESFQRVKAHGDVAGKGPAYFEVTNRNGATSFYGKRATTREVDTISGAVAVWKIDKLVDSNSNTLSYHYEDVSGNNEVQLTQITYGGNEDMGVAEHLAVQLVYEDRPDKSSSWSRGQQYSQTKRVYGIQTRVGSTLVKDYRLTYEQGVVTGASRLTAVQLCAGDGDCYRPTQFEYAPETQNSWSASSLSLPSAAQTADGKPLGLLVDINNDGKTDWVNAYISSDGTTTLSTQLGSSSGWQGSADFVLPDVLFDYQSAEDGFAKGLLLDVNGDGWLDYVQAYQTDASTTIQTWRNTGVKFERDASLDLPTALTSLTLNGEVRSLADVADLNADGLVDVVQSVNMTGTPIRQTWVQEFDGGNHSWQLSTSYQAPTVSIDYTQGTEGRLFATIQDVNGDGLSDWVQSYRLNGVVHNATWLNSGQGFESTPDDKYSFPTPVVFFDYDLLDAGVSLYNTMDINGDGLPDLVKSVNLIRLEGDKEYDTWIHNGNGWHQNSSYNLPNNMFRVSDNGNHETIGGLVDLNLDGHPDFVRSAHATWTGATATAVYLYDKANQSWSLTSDFEFPFINNQLLEDGSSFSTAEIADLNHDGYPELINTLSGEVYETNQGGDYPGTLTKTISPLGAITELTYGISTDADVYELSDQSVYPNVAYNSPARVVKEISASDGIGGMISAIHRYGKAKMNLLGQGGLGYEYHSMQDGNTGVEVITTFHQVYPYAGRIKSSIKRLGSTLFSESSSEMELQDITINGLATQYAHPSGSISRSYDLDGNLIKILRSTSEIDDFGNSVVSTESVFDANDHLVRRSSKNVEYKEPDLARWLFGLPETVTSSVFDQATNKTYTNVAIAEFYEDGKPKNETLEPASSQWVKKAYVYDGFGNRVSSTVTAAGVTEARTNSTTFTNDGRFPETVKNALNHTITTTFDVNIGKPLTVTDANGITKEFVYDGFGTVVKETKVHQSNGATRGRQIVLPKWCDDNPDTNCPTNAVYFIAAFDDEGEAPEIAYYDVNGKELRKQTYGFEGKIIVVETEYDANGRVIGVTQPYFKDEYTDTWSCQGFFGGSVDVVIGPNSPSQTCYKYDVLGREVERRNAAGERFYTRYNHLTVETENPGNNDTARQVTRVINNIFGQPIESIDPDQNSTLFEYDGRGKLVRTVDAKNNVATITYDDVFGRKIAMNDPDLGAWTYEYDSLGNLVAQTDAIGQRTEMTHDILNRVVRRVDDVGGAKEEITTWDYSETKGDGNVIGGLAKVTSPNYERTVKYDNLNRVVEATSVINGESFTQRTGYLGTADKVDWIEYPSGLSVRNTYDEYGFPKTVEGITLDHDKYLQFQTASKELNDLQRQLEAYKNTQLSDAELFQLEEHEREVRRLGKALSEFYDEFDDNPLKKEYEDEAARYTDLVKRVQQKLEQHGNWYNIYQKELDTRYNRIKDDLKRLEEIPALSAPYERAYADAKALHDNYAAKVSFYAGKLNEHGAIINHHLGIALDARIHVNNLIDSLYKPEQAVRYKIPDNLNMSGIEVMFHDLDCCYQHVVNNFMKTQSAEMIESHMNQINNWLGVIQTSAGHMEHHQSIIDDNQYQYWYDHWEPRRASEEAKMASAASYINQYASEANTLNNRVKPDLDRINDWLVPITQSHNNVILSFNDRARAYVTEISKQTGSYARREDIKSENYLKSFKNHVEYIRCLRDQSGKTTGQCYAENLVHVLNDDGSVNTTEQNEARAKVESDALVDIKQFWSTRRFFCPAYYGYSCPSKYSTEIKQVAKTLHARQCARMTAGQKENSSVPCDTNKWNDTNTSNGNTYPKYSYLTSDVTDFSSNLNNFYAALVSKHQDEVSRLVTNATLNTYNSETNYHDIIQLGGNLWQASTPTESEGCETSTKATALSSMGKHYTHLKNDSADDVEDCTDPREFVLLYKGEVQRLAYTEMDSVAREANRDLKDHQYAVAQLINIGDAEAYATLYLAVQNKAEEVDRLYKEIDQAYATASNDDNFNDDEFNGTKKIYWQAEDINSKGQIKKAKYGNGTVTEWGYDQFGRINNHITKNANGLTLLNNAYEYDAIGNLVSRVDFVEDVTENFSYDILNRLVGSDLSGTGTQYVAQVNGDSVDYGYDELGNLIYKSDISGGGVNGHYTYGSTSSGQHAGPHAVTFISGLGNFTYDNNGNQLTGNGRTVTYNAFNKPTSIIKNGLETKMWYGPERQLVQQQQPTPQGLETTIHVGGLFEQINIQGGGIKNRHHIAVAGQAIAVVETQPGSLLVTKESYLHKNHQSSVIAISDSQGDVAERRYYDVFGDIKNHIGQASNQYTSWLGYGTITTMAFTGHRTMIAAGVIHMGGRVYDASIGRFLSADPHIQSPLNSQSLNRYSYTLNNPLSWTDPSGYFFKSIFKALKSIFKKIGAIIKSVLKVVKKVVKVIAKVIKKIGQFIKKYWRVIVAVAVVWFAPQITAALMLPTTGLAGAMAVGAVAGGLSGLVMTGSLTGALKGAVFGALSGAIAYGIGSMLPSNPSSSTFAGAVNKTNSSLYNNLVRATFDSSGKRVFLNHLSGWGKFVKSAAHGIGQGVVGKLRGGSFSKNFISTFVSNGGQEFGLTATSAGAGLVGGFAQELAGGDFSEGFITSWAVAELNHKIHGKKIKRSDIGQHADKNLGEDFFARVDSIDGSTFEVHIYRYSGGKLWEVGIANEDGWLKKHGHNGTRPSGLSDKSSVRIKGLIVNELDARRAIPGKGGPSGRERIKILKQLGSKLGMPAMIYGLFSDQQACRIDPTGEFCAY